MPAKKKHNPSLFSWLIDPIDGLFSPLMTVFPKAIMEAVPKLVVGIPTGISLGAITEAGKLATQIMTPDVPVDLAQFQKDMRAAAVTADSLGVLLLTSSTLAAAIPFINVGDAIDEIWRLPSPNAAIDIGRNIWAAPYRYGTDMFLKRFWQKHYTPLIPETYRLAMMAATNVISNTAYEDAMKESGLDPFWAAAWKEIQYVRPSVTELLAMTRRGIVTIDYAMNRLMLTGYSMFDAAKMMGLLAVIPPLTDLIHMAVREAFGKHTYEEQYPAYESWAKKMGLSTEFAEAYWYAHWERIPLAQAYENYWRGLWTKDEFERILRIKDVHPDDRKAIMDVAFRPPSIREMGYGYDVGAYSKKDIIRYRRWGGLSPADAEKAATSLVDYRVSAEREAVRREWMYKYARGETTEAGFVMALKGLRTSEEAIKLWVVRGQLYRQRMTKPEEAVHKIPTKAELTWMYAHSAITAEMFNEMLKREFGYDDNKAAIVTAQAEAAREKLKEVPAVKIREMTISDLRAAFRYEIMDEVAFRLELEKRNYERDDIDVITTLELYRRPVPPEEAIPEITYSQLAGLFRRGIITEAEFRAELVERKYTTEDINRLVADEIAKGIVPPPEITYRDLTLSQITRMFNLGLIDEPTLLMRIEDLGYSKEDAEILAELYKVIEPEVEVDRRLTATDIRHFYDVGIYDVSDVIEGYEGLGYKPEDAINQTIYTQVGINFPDLKALYRNGWITADVIHSELVSYGLTPTRADELVMTVVKAEQPARLAKERDITKGEILKGVQLAILSAEEAVKLFEGMGYDEMEAWYILLVNKALAEKGKVSYWAWRQVVEAWRKASGYTWTEIPEAILILEVSLQQHRAEVERLKATRAPEEEIAIAIGALSRIEQEMTRLLQQKGLA